MLQTVTFLGFGYIFHLPKIKNLHFLCFVSIDKSSFVTFYPRQHDFPATRFPSFLTLLTFFAVFVLELIGIIYTNYCVRRTQLSYARMDPPTNHGRNLSVQGGGVQMAKSVISEAVADKLDVHRFLASSNSINIAYLGCLVGYQTFETIVECLKRKSRDDKLEEIQFQLFVNQDHVFKDPDMVSKSTPPNRKDFAASLPASTHCRLFPKAALHFVYSPYAIHWLSKVPDELIDKESLAFNKGRIFYTNASREVVEAYAAQFARDMEVFLNARAEELVSEGLMGLLVPCFEVHTNPPLYPPVGVIDLLGDCLMDMVNMGLMSEDKVDSFNFPKYNATLKETEEIIKVNGHFTIEKMQRLGQRYSKKKSPSIHMFMLHLQDSWGGLIETHFGREVVDDVFGLLRKKIVTSSILIEANMSTVTECFILLRNKAT